MHLTATLVLATMPAREDSHTQRPARLLGAGSGPSGLRPRGRILGWCGKKVSSLLLLRRLAAHLHGGMASDSPDGLSSLGPVPPRRLACTCTLSCSTKLTFSPDRGFTQRLIETNAACMPHPRCSPVCHALGAVGRGRVLLVVLGSALISTT
jgi:hypothetical protein